MENKRDINMNELTDDMLDEVSGGFMEQMHGIGSGQTLGDCIKCGGDNWIVRNVPDSGGMMIMIECKDCGYSYVQSRFKLR